MPSQFYHFHGPQIYGYKCQTFHRASTNIVS